MANPLCFLLGHALVPAESDGASPCVTCRRCRRCGSPFRTVAHGAMDVLTSPGDRRVAVLRCRRCGLELSEWMTDPATWTDRAAFSAS